MLKNFYLKPQDPAAASAASIFEASRQTKPDGRAAKEGCQTMGHANWTIITTIHG
ncbi:hypothetical protein [Pseudomonas poae]|uniref:hypothetical protein n=1 Tax=Pseudomonas poae TaxID=200451 RepID=UPI0030D13C38